MASHFISSFQSDSLQVLPDITDVSFSGEVEEQIEDANNQSFGLSFVAFLLANFTNSDVVDEEKMKTFSGNISSLVDRISCLSCKGKDIAYVILLMRQGLMRLFTTPTILFDVVPRTAGLYLPLSLHANIINKMAECVENGNPDHIVFPGDKNSILQISSVLLPNLSAYTMTMWIKIDDVDESTKGCLLVRARHSHGGLDLVLSEKQPDGRRRVTIRSKQDSTNTTADAHGGAQKNEVMQFNFD